MNESEDPFGHLPLALIGIVFGGLVAVGCGYVTYYSWAYEYDPSPPPPLSDHVSLEGKIDWAAGLTTPVQGMARTRIFRFRLEGIVVRSPYPSGGCRININIALRSQRDTSGEIVSGSRLPKQ